MQQNAMVWLQWVCVVAAALTALGLVWAALRQPLPPAGLLQVVLNLGMFALLWTGARASERSDLTSLIRALYAAAALLGTSTLVPPLLDVGLAGAGNSGLMAGILGASVLGLYPALGLVALAAVLGRVQQLMQDEALTV